jgi:hypothetical protein
MPQPYRHLPATKPDIHAPIARHTALGRARIAQMRYFGGYCEQQIAETPDITEHTVQLDWDRMRLKFWRRRYVEAIEQTDDPIDSSDGADEPAPG